jgi:hypothetical protein
MNKDYLYFRELYHYGIKGQKWGIRRFENEDGTLTSAGKLRYGGDSYANMSKNGRKQYDNDKKAEQYRTNSLNDIDDRYKRSIANLGEDLKKYDKKISKAEEKGKTKKVDKLKAKQTIQRGKLYYNEMLRDLEKKKVNEMSLESLNKERQAANKNARLQVLFSLLDNSSTYYEDAYIYGVQKGNKDEYRQNSRISDYDKQVILEKAQRKAAQDSKKKH